MKDKEYLWNILNLNENFKCSDVDIAYKNIEKKTDEVILAWKLLQDEYYSKVYKKYLDIDIVKRAGFIVDKLERKASTYYNLNFLTVSMSKIKKIEYENEKIPVVLLSTGGFDPIHDGHIYMMEFAKKTLENNRI